ncbi:mercuric transporter MerT family protein [Chitinasiproducens palmae]|uniref:Mercuric transport protein MerT n=1 Tax=Chitinasiproducens palmae TaxID=1770053 RepID=A0A1H2PVY2_9BURK|nr:mercuric transporter MerT family protein [Chitinasiproducens palmae]SDV51498.1 mercuric ion transport protein [Chitinasiproducens palmae]
MDAPVVTTRRSARWPLLGAALAALLASTCCLGPLLLVLLGLGGAWLAHLSALAPYQPFFVAAALLALAVATPRLFGRAARCAPDQSCASPPVRRVGRVGYVLVVLLLLIVLTTPWTMRWFY